MVRARAGRAIGRAVTAGCAIGRATTAATARRFVIWLLARRSLRWLAVAFDRDRAALAILQMLDALFAARRFALFLIAARAAKFAPQLFGRAIVLVRAPGMIR